MKLSFTEYKDKVMGCWAGKNIGGVLGAPFECKRQMNDVTFYTQDLSNGPPANDDLDLQIVWLTAVERYGRQVNASILGEYWLSYVVPNWAEYGTGKANLAAGLTPPLSGNHANQYKNSCGCFIRSEIWACLSPGRPDVAVRYAYEDAIVDHAGEGVYGELFCAALESAAFVESDVYKLIDIGLGYIPADSAVALCVKKALECYEQRMSLADARRCIHNTAPGTFGLLGQKPSDTLTEGGAFEIGTPGFDAPENIGYVIAGLLYGEGDFGKSLCTAVNCGEDTDCSGATLGSILGIIMGASQLPEKWTAPLNDKIETLCINLTSWNGIWVPKTVTELTDRLLRVTPLFLGPGECDLFAEGGYTIECLEGEALRCPADDYLPRHIAGEWPRGLSARQLAALGPNVVRYAYPTHLTLVDYGKDVFFSGDETRKLKVTVINSNLMLQQMWCTIRLHVPENVAVVDGCEYRVPLNTLYGDKAEVVFEIDASAYCGGALDLLVDIHFPGRHTSTPVRATLLRKPRTDAGGVVK